MLVEDCKMSLQASILFHPVHIDCELMHTTEQDDDNISCLEGEVKTTWEQQQQQEQMQMQQAQQVAKMAGDAAPMAKALPEEARAIVNAEE